MKTYNPHPYQAKAIDWLIEKPSVNNGGSGLFLDMGLGKTSCVLEAFRQLQLAGKVKRMLVVAPLKVIQLTWPGEIRKWSNFCHFSFTILHGPDKASKLNQDVDIYLINYEGLDWLTDQKWVAPSVIVFDELSKMKSWKAQRVKAFKPFIPLFKYRWGLTGTPVPNGYYDIFSQTFMLDNGKTFGKYITHFCEAYFNPLEKNQFKPKPKLEEVPNIAEKLARIFYRLEGVDWLNLPEEIHNAILIELPKPLQAKYNELKKEFILSLSEEENVTAVSAAALSSKLRQFLSGNIYISKDTYTFIHSLKADALKDIVDEQQGKPILVGYQFRHEIEMYKKHFKDAVFLDEYKDTIRLQKVIDKWNEGKVPLMFGHPASIAHGLNLQSGGNTIVFTSLDFNLENYMQFIKRVSRQGQAENHVFIHYILFKSTIDELILKALRSKDLSQRKLLDIIKELQ